jgi:glycosyltransferase involved in cell wall biosynthesis
MNKHTLKKNKPYPFLNSPVRVTEQMWGENVLPLVSIHCKTYMHEPYIRQAIEGFLMQETTFKVEILIHDDASTDNTAKIIREYESKYPHLIKATYQVENQYRKNPKTEKYVKPYPFTGKYRAHCEGDDYWIDSLKLQKQVDILERHPNLVACFTNAKIKREDGSRGRAYRYSLKAKNRIFKPNEVIAKGGGFYPTASLVYRNSLLSNYAKMPKSNAAGDVRLASYLATKGAFFFLNEVTCVYRMHGGGVYTSIINNEFSYINRQKDKLLFLSDFESYTNGRFNRAVQKAVAIVHVKVLYFYIKKKPLQLFDVLKTLSPRNIFNIIVVIAEYKIFRQ